MVKVMTMVMMLVMVMMMAEFQNYGYQSRTLNLLGREVSQHSVGRTRMINLPAELGWISKNLPLGPWAVPSGFGSWGRFLLTQPCSAGRFIPDLNEQTSRSFVINEHKLTQLNNISRNVDSLGKYKYKQKGGYPSYFFLQYFSCAIHHKVCNWVFPVESLKLQPTVVCLQPDWCQAGKKPTNYHNCSFDPANFCKRA